MTAVKPTDSIEKANRSRDGQQPGQSLQPSTHELPSVSATVSSV